MPRGLILSLQLRIHKQCPLLSLSDEREERGVDSSALAENVVLLIEAREDVHRPGAVEREPAGADRRLPPHAPAAQLGRRQVRLPLRVYENGCASHAREAGHEVFACAVPPTEQLDGKYVGARLVDGENNRVSVTASTWPWRQRNKRYKVAVTFMGDWSGRAAAAVGTRNKLQVQEFKRERVAQLKNKPG